MYKLLELLFWEGQLVLYELTNSVVKAKGELKIEG